MHNNVSLFYYPIDNIPYIKLESLSMMSRKYVKGIGNVYYYDQFCLIAFDNCCDVEMYFMVCAILEAEATVCIHNPNFRLS